MKINRASQMVCTSRTESSNREGMSVTPSFVSSCQHWPQKTKGRLRCLRTHREEKPMNLEGFADTSTGQPCTLHPERLKHNQPIFPLVTPSNLPGFRISSAYQRRIWTLKKANYDNHRKIYRTILQKCSYLLKNHSLVD